MSAPGPILQEIHRLKRFAKDLAAKIEQGPRLVKAQQNALAKQEELLKQNQEAIKKFKVGIHEKEVSIKAVEQHIAKLDKTEISNKKEYDALRVEKEAAQKNIRAIEDEILDMMAEMEDKIKQTPELEKAIAKARNDAQQLEKDHQEKLGRWQSERQRAVGELKQVEASLPEDIRPFYQRLINAKGEDGMAAVEGTTCSACYTEVTSQMINELSRGVFVLCKNCGRMLYKTDSSPRASAEE